MQYRCIHTAQRQRTFAIILATGDEVVSSLQGFIEKENVHAAAFTAIGALSDASLRYFDWEKKEYQKIPVKQSSRGCISDRRRGRGARRKADASHPYRLGHA
jgi:hypothetical protein